jgi:hypothetical protein
VASSSRPSLLDAAAGTTHCAEARWNAVARELDVERACDVTEALGCTLRDLEATVERRFS